MNKIAVRLAGYFAIVLVVFSLVIGLTFTLLFRSYSIDLNKIEMETRANNMADTFAELLDTSTNSRRHGHSGMGMGGYGAYVRFMGDIAGTDVWAVDKDLNLITSGHGHMGMSSYYDYKDLPEGAETIILEVLQGKTVFSHDFSQVLDLETLSVGVPITGSRGDILGAILLHSPVKGVESSVAAGGKLLFVSLVAALLAASLLAVFLSKKFTDPITQKEAEDALSMEKARREFVANISHELKTPVTVIRGSLEALVDKVVSDPEQIDEYHEQMLSETLFLERLVGDLLDLSRLQNVDFTIESEPVSVSQVLGDVLRTANQMADKKDITIHTYLDDDPLMVQGDYGRLRQMLLVVLDNAIKFSPEKGFVQVAVKDKIITVVDSGQGIDPESLPYIFERFYQSRWENDKTGTGLGLAIANQIAHRHNIGLYAGNTKDYGAVFTFDLRKADTPQK